MQLGLKKDEVKIVPYDPQWKEEFEKIKRVLVANPHLATTQIEHIGSTSIEGIRAKPIIDLVIGVTDIKRLEKDFFKRLQQVGFYRLQVERPKEIVCAKFTDDTFETKTHFVHLVDVDKERWKQFLSFRDYLNTNPEVRQQYENLKQSFFETELAGVMAYTAYKEAFVQSIFSLMEKGKNN